MMVLLALGLILAGIFGYTLLKRRAVAVANPNTESTAPAEFVNAGGINFVTKLSGYDTEQLAGRPLPAAYDPSNPDTAQRRLDALDRAKKLELIAADAGKTVDQYYADRVTSQVAAGKTEMEVISKVAGFTPTNADETYKAIEAAGPTSGQPPGTYWDYAQQKWVPMYF